MKISLLILSAALCGLLAACSASLSTTELLSQSIPIANGQALFMSVDSGRIEITNGSNGVVQVLGQVPAQGRGKTSITTADDGVHFVVTTKPAQFWQTAPPATHLDVQVPAGAAVSVDTYDGSVKVHDLRGSVAITSVAGNVQVLNSSGQFSIKANRGDVTLDHISGQIGVAGNYGIVTMQDTRGSVSAATILGTLRFMGAVKLNDALKLETDHGPAELHLANDTDASVLVTTTSGVVTCTVPGLYGTGPGCAGKLNNGLGQITVRTVSGSVLVEPLH